MLNKLFSHRLAHEWMLIKCSKLPLALGACGDRICNLHPISWSKETYTFEFWEVRAFHMKGNSSYDTSVCAPETA